MAQHIIGVYIDSVVYRYERALSDAEFSEIPCIPDYWRHWSFPEDVTTSDPAYRAVMALPAILPKPGQAQSDPAPAIRSVLNARPTGYKGYLATSG